VRRASARTMMWAAGVRRRPRVIGSGPRRIVGRVKVGPDLSIPHRRNIFVIGDTALMVRTVHLPRHCPGSEETSPRACKRGIDPSVPQSGLRHPWRQSGASAPSSTRSLQARWLAGLDASPTSTFLIGFRNRPVVAMNWARNHVTFQLGTRLITGVSGSLLEDMNR